MKIKQITISGFKKLISWRLNRGKSMLWLAPMEVGKAVHWRPFGMV